MQKSSKSTLARWRESKKKPQANAILRKPADTSAPLTYGQQRLWFLQELYPENPFYNYAEAYRFRGNLNVNHLLKSLEYVALRHDILRTTFELNDGQIRQIVHRDSRFQISQFNLENHPNSESEAQKIAFREANKYFELTADSLTRITLIKLSQNDHLLVLTMHHIITDKWSMRILRDDLAIAYRAFQNGEIPLKNPLSIQYGDYAYWQKKQSLSNDKDLNYWQQKLAGELPVLTLPIDHSALAKCSFKGNYAVQKFSSELSQQLILLSQKTNTTLFVLILTAYKILLYRYSGQTDILVGTPFANRDKKELEALIGFFNETLVLRSDLSENPKFVDLLAEVRTTVLDAFSHKNTPFETLVKTLQPERTAATNPIFQVMFLYHDVPPNPEFSSDLSLTHEPFDLGVAKFDLTLYIANDEGQLTAIFEYATDLFKPETIGRMHTHLQVLLRGIISNPNKKIAQLPILSETEKQTILYDWNLSSDISKMSDDSVGKENGKPKSSNIFKVSDDSSSILDIFQKNVKITPNAIAVKDDNQTLTYADLNQKSNTLAVELQQLGVDKNTFVGLLVGRSVEMMIGILGIMKAGGAYLPLDPEYPAGRIEFMLKDADVPVIVAQEKYVQDLPKTQAEIFKFKDIKATGGMTSLLKEIEVRKNNFAYIIYTSGSTGKPKGVPVTHQNLLDSTLARFDYYPQHPGCFLLMSSFAFDSSVAGIFWSLTSGGTLLIPPRRIEQDTEKLCNIIYENKVTHTLMLPSLYSTLLQYSNSEKLTSLNTVIVAGEACPPSLITLHFEQLSKTKLYNEYGPTEATVWCTVHEITFEDTQRIPIGRPTSNAGIYILDSHLQPIPVNIVGELYVGGSGVTQGYHHRTDLTESRFVTNPFTDTDARMYRTGDLASYRTDGTIDFLGRADRQVKIRGYRIEPDEIATVIKQHPTVQDALVTVQKNEQRLVAYFIKKNEKNSVREKVLDTLKVSDTSSQSTDELRRFVKSKLPEYMLPSAWVVLDNFPLLPNGKINLNALPVPVHLPSANGSNFTAPRNEIEQKLIEIWQEVLNIKVISIHDNFFEIGGDSILSIQIIAKARKAGLQLKANQIFEHQSISELALFVQSAEKLSITNEIYTGEIALTPIQHWFFDEHRTAPHHWNMAMQIEVEPIISPEITDKSVSHLIEINDALRLSFQPDQIEGILEIPSISASVLSPGEIHLFKHYNYKNTPISDIKNKIKTEISHIHANLKLSEGSLFQVAYFDCPDTHSNVVVFIAHHLIIDVVSWQIIIEDFKTICSQIIDNKKITINRKPTTFKDWSEYLSNLATKNYFSDELAFWQKQSKINVDFPTDFDYNSPIKEEDIEHVIFELDATNTQALLQETNSTYSTKTDEVLLTALVQAIFSFTNKNEIQIALERHGRDVFDEIDVTNTIGWFTSFFPLNFTLENPQDIGTSLKSVKEQMRRVPNSGLDYGVLRYLQNEDIDSQAPIIFNYLGNQKSSETDIFGVAEMVFEDARHPESERHHLLEINALIKNEKLEVRWSYSPKIHRRRTIENLIKNFEKNLRNLITHCQNTEKQYTLSDFPEANLNEKDLQKLTTISSTVEGIYPLSFMQNALLFHHLQAEADEGLLHLTCTLQGGLNQAVFRKAWQGVMKRHSALRASIHWEGIKQPMQVVLSEVDLDIEVLDWRDISKESLYEKLIKYKEKDVENGLSLSQMSINRLTLIQTQNTEYQLIWLCHHILLDGWSAVMILKDVVEYYTAISEERVVNLEAIPTYASYLKWTKKQDKNLAQKFWKNYLADFKTPTLINGVSAKTPSKNRFTNYSFSLSEKTTNALYTYTRTHRVTLNTLMQGAWAMLLKRFTAQDDVVFGTTVSGRNIDLPNVELMAGLFMNVMPVRMKWDDEKALSISLNRLQIKQLEARNYDYINLDEVISSVDTLGHGALFDSLLVVENFPWDDIENGGLTLTNFKGGITTTYPLTIVLVPGKVLQFHIRYDVTQVPESTVEWIAKSFEVIFSSLSENMSVSELSECIEKPEVSNNIRNSTLQISDTENYIAARNTTELELTKIWEELFGQSPIGIKDNFFEIGGTSLMAVRLFSRIEEKLGHNLPPVTLLKHPKIESLAKVLQSEDSTWNTLVPLRTKGQRKPLFCIHAGGGHVLFYKDLADNLSSNQPVYAIQPEGLDGSDFSYNSIEEMTAIYLKQMRAVQPEGPYFILGMCFSNAVAFEMAKQLDAAGEKVGMLVIVDSAPGFMRKDPPRKKGRLEKFINKFRDTGFRAIVDVVIRKSSDRWLPKSNEQERNLNRVMEKFGQVIWAYRWQPHKVKITLIRSQEHLDRTDKEFHVYTWEYLSQQELDVFHVPGTHADIFTGEAVKIIANELQKRMDDER